MATIYKEGYIHFKEGAYCNKTIIAVGATQNSNATCLNVCVTDPFPVVHIFYF